MTDVGKVMGMLSSFQKDKDGQELDDHLLEVEHPLSTKAGKMAMFILLLGLMLLWAAI